jgi:hypothetical protein
MTSTRPYTDSILGPLTPWDMKVGDVICDTCGKVLIADIKLRRLHYIGYTIECAILKHREDVGHKQCTLKWIPIIEQKLKDTRVF